MKIKKVVIDNFKSIDHIELDFDKVGDSYTKIFVGVNESGKSNILEALSYFNAPKDKIPVENYFNQKNDEKNICGIFFHLDLDEPTLNFNIPDESGADCLISCTIINLQKQIILTRRSDHYKTCYMFRADLSPNNLYYRENGSFDKPIIISKEPKRDFKLLNEAEFRKIFFKEIDNAIVKEESFVSIWKPSKEYLLTDLDLNIFSSDIESNKPLRSIFYLAGYRDKVSISEAVRKVSILKKRENLQSKLQTSLNDYISKVWDNPIDILINISERGMLSFLIRDKGVENIHDRFEISERSQGAQQFLSLILSLSLESECHERKNELILIDEPEVHLHPSGIRDLGKELLKVGHDNYVFLATHSPFIIDKQHKERHYIVKKNKKAITEIQRIKESDNIIDDEVLNEAFGINVYKDLLNPHSILVEGATDKVILQKAFDVLGKKNIGITNGHGTNIDTLASKMNFDNFSVLVVVDDDKDGQKYKEKIIKIGGPYNENTVYTIHDLVGDVVNNGTIEDTLELEYVKSKFIEFYKKQYTEEPSDFNLLEGEPFINQLTVYLQKKKKYTNWDMDAFKKLLSDDLKLTKTSLERKFSLLKNLAEAIVEKLK